MKFYGPELLLLGLALITGEPFWLWLTILYLVLRGNKP